MYRRFHDRFGTAGVVIGIIALIAALGGTAIAAGGLNGPTKKLIQKEAKKWGKKYAKTGPAGPQGPAGTNGTNGTNGKDGANGTNGEKGEKGDPGGAGESVTSSPIGLTGEEGECVGVGGVKLVVGASKTYVCNGEEGEAGQNGQTGFTETLPKGKTEKGAWSAPVMEFVAFHSVGAHTAISFGIPAPSAPTAVYVKQGKTGIEHTTECPATTATEPKAAEGFLCIYSLNDVSATYEETETYAAGAYLSLEGGTLGVVAHGTWAVTSAN